MDDAAAREQVQGKIAAAAVSHMYSVKQSRQSRLLADVGNSREDGAVASGGRSFYDNPL
jgi:hypothetical protein